MIQTHLPRFWSDFLTFKPETGMGYQVVEILFTDGSISHGMVLNTQVMLTHGDVDYDTIREMTVMDRNQIPESFLESYDASSVTLDNDDV